MAPAHRQGENGAQGVVASDRSLREDSLALLTGQGCSVLVGQTALLECLQEVIAGCLVSHCTCLWIDDGGVQRRTEISK
jgi:hypothetical protein